MATTKTKGVSKAKVSSTAKTLTAKRTAKRDANARKGVKRHYEDKGANYLLTAIATVLNLPTVLPMDARSATAPTVIIDARKVVRHLTANLHKRPDLTIHARMLSLAKVDKAIAKVGYLRYLPSPKHPHAVAGNDDAYKVILYRTK